MGEDEQLEEQRRINAEVRDLERTVACLKVRRGRYLRKVSHILDYMETYLSDDALEAEANVYPDFNGWPTATEVKALFDDLRSPHRKLAQAKGDRSRF